MKTPVVTRTYENHHLDSPRWDRFETRPGDIVITTAYKSGTTWMQNIVANLVFQDGDIPGPVMEISPWVDMRVIPFEGIMQRTAAQQHRRFLKTHLPLDGYPYRPDVSYIYVGRDLRDVFMSLWNHYRNHTPAFFDIVNNPDTLVGEPLPPCPGDIKAYWDQWVSRGWFDWEHDGYPHWSASHHAQTWWDFRHLPNILFVHYADLLADPTVEIQRVADFLELEVTPENLGRVVEAVSFKTMKNNADDIVGGASVFWEGGAQRFLNKGTNGRWREVLDQADLDAYDKMKKKSLSRECADWLEQGRTVLTGAALP
jgi:aryl sulfotransferase